MSFSLDPILARDTLLICRLTLCEVRLMNDAQYPWVILVPQIPDVTELYQLTETQQHLLSQESNQVSQLLVALLEPDKLNVAALGNVVKQLHIHHIARFCSDPAWPAPVWGKLPIQPYPSDNPLLLELKAAFAKASNAHIE